MTYAVDHIYDWFYYLESLFYDWYFCTLVFYVTYRVLTKSPNTSVRRLNIFKGCFVVIMIAFLAIFIYSGLSKIKECKCTSYVTYRNMVSHYRYVRIGAVYCYDLCGIRKS